MEGLCIFSDSPSEASVYARCWLIVFEDRNLLLSNLSASSQCLPIQLLPFQKDLDKRRKDVCSPRLFGFWPHRWYLLREELGWGSAGSLSAISFPAVIAAAQHTGTCSALPLPEYFSTLCPVIVSALDALCTIYKKGRMRRSHPPSPLGQVFLGEEKTGSAQETVVSGIL